MKKEVNKTEGDYDYRKMAYFYDKKGIKAKKLTLEKVLKDFIKLQKNNRSM